ncbi:MAG: VanW family protein [Clostridia bacterium]|nr:VanW family protein [Clostridia bacterium]
MEKSNLKVEELENKTIEKQEESKEEAKEEIKEKTKEDLKEESKEVKNSKKNVFPIIITCVIFIVALIFSTIFALMNINNNNIVSGVKIEGIDVSGLTQEEAKSKINIIYEEKKQKDIKLKYEDYETTINPELLETTYDIDGAIEEAISIGKNNNIIVNNYNILLALIGKKDINVNMTINEEITKKTVEDIGKNITGAVVEPAYYIENDQLIITKGKEGLKVDTENLINKLKNHLENININQEYIDMPVTNKIPEQIDIEKIHQEIYKEVQDAYYTKDPFTIHPEVEGVDFNLDEAKAILQEDKDEYIIQLIITKPKVTTSQIGSEAFPDLLATYTTKYNAGDVDRTTNLKIACQKINDKVILPGETFSYNQTLGERSIATGYKNAKVFENGQVVDGIGGGICQISTTLYNAVLMSNLEVTDRSNHQFVTSYAPAGRDATVVYGQTDFKFKNTRTCAIKIKAGISGGVATVSIYGVKEQEEYTVSFSTKTISTIPFTVKYVDDNTLAVGTEKVQQKGANGIITETYITKSLNGKVVSTKLLSKDTYNAMQKIILKGTKGATTNVDTNANTNMDTNSNTNNNEQNNKQETKPAENKEVVNSIQNTDNKANSNNVKN